jgi:hypothetical protein
MQSPRHICARNRDQRRSASGSVGLKDRSFSMNYRSLALTIVALSSVHIATAAAQSIYVAPGGVYIGGGPVYVIPAPSNGNGAYVEPTYGNGYGVREPTPYLAPTVVAPGAGYVAATPYGLNGNGYGYGYGPPPPAYYNGDPVLSAYGRARLSDRAPRPPAMIPYNGNGRCIARGYSRCY